ncbi:serine protease [Pelatocladus sp. BLCC-F211]|uniref:S1 family peptidase n=1 Tax=Pelatocladus sp. BLCC-F211 TaxID=3342752 RepID=UPI0035BB08F9
MLYKQKLLLLVISAIVAVAGGGLILKLMPAQFSMPINQSIPNPNVTSGVVPEEKNSTLEYIAQEVTVRILTEPGSGSGVVIDRRGQNYTVLTNRHVVVKSKGNSYKVLTVDGQIHPARLKSEPNFQGIDLALVEFASKIPYPKAKLGNSNTLSVGHKVYATGFPNYRLINKDNMEDTRNWGRKAFRFTTGKIARILQRSLLEGYSLGYTNEIELGMSGGPVFNEKGEVVGINGRLKYPIQGIDAFTFVDGTKPSIEEFEKMESLSWAIPISKYRQLAE